MSGDNPQDEIETSEDRDLPRDTGEVIEDIKNLVRSQGYIYSLLMALFGDFHIDPETLHEDDVHSKLSFNEACLLIGFLLKQKIDFSQPESMTELMRMKEETYSLLRELHDSFHKPFIIRLRERMLNGPPLTPEPDPFATGAFLVEPIFYAGTGAYDFQYLDFLERRYKHDFEWLLQNKEFKVDHAKVIFAKLKDLLHEKSLRVQLHPRQQTEKLVAEINDRYSGEEAQKVMSELLPSVELHQYVDLFFDDEMIGLSPDSTEFREAAWKSFYKNLVDLFTIRKNDLAGLAGADAFLRNFSASPGQGCNDRFETAGDYNIAKSHPLIRIDEDTFLLPLPFVLAEAIYESPYYWMVADKEYANKSASNRGEAGEEIALHFLSQVFKKSIYRRVKVSSQKGRDKTDVDVLCLLGSKALCVQVKSQKLTQLSKKGDEAAIKKDFKRAVQEAFDQGEVARKAILDRSAKFFDEKGSEIVLSEDIDEVYVLVLTTDNYPSLTHQSNILLEKERNTPAPLVLNIFDLEIVSHYLSDPFDFLYYVRQRITLADVVRGNDEMSYLGFHLSRKLWKDPGADFISIGQNWAQLIDRNYFPFRCGITTSGETDPLNNRWRSAKFEMLCDEIKQVPASKTTDILFHLYDFSGSARESLIDAMTMTKDKVLQDGKYHSMSLPPDTSVPVKVGLTYFASETNSPDELQKRLMVLSKLRKYKSKGDVWIGFGSFKNSNRLIDCISLDQSPWAYDEYLERNSNQMRGTYKSLRTSQKVGRNDQCPCGSGRKFKKCCGSPTRN